MLRSRIAPALLAVVTLAGCGSSAEPEWSPAIDFPFPIEAADEAIRAAGGFGGVPHWLEGNWGVPESNGMWLLGRGGALVAALEPVPTRLIIDAQTSADMVQQGQELEVVVNGHALASVEIAAWGPSDSKSIDLPPRWLAADRDRIEFRPGIHRGYLDAHAKQEFAIFFKQLRIEQSGSSGGKRPAEDWVDPAQWADVELRGGEANAATALTPDLLIVVLDAARADHFGSYGYGRATTPFIDSLAADGVVLHDLHAVAPFTRCSMPSFLTGTPWFVHQMALKEDRLPSGIATIAELLGRMGYQRLALSESPHVSFGSGLDRGFEEFWESWNRPDLARLAREAGGDLLVALFAQLLQANLDERPAFTLVHMLPPHVPYVPTGEFDLWTEDDPASSWKSVGPGELKAFSRGTRTLSESKRRRLVALYDGNLRRADDLVRKLVEHWRNLGRERPLHILITSDHGEALGEHGIFGHNFSLFDEMTEIPGVLWPRQAFLELAGREGELWSNEDLLALLLRSIGWKPSESVTLPQRFAQIVEGRTPQRQAVLMRSLLEIGARSSDRLWTFDRRQGPSVFDLSVDPMASTNLFARDGREFPWWVAGLRGSLRSSQTAASASADTIAGADLERLKALGYVD